MTPRRLRECVCCATVFVCCIGCSDDRVAPLLLADSTPPSRVSDLLAFSSSDGRTAYLRWTAPGDDGELGRADFYDLRFATEPITSEVWKTATPLAAARPADPGLIESTTVMGFESSTTVFFGLRVLDEAGNPSQISNTAILSMPPPPGLEQLTMSPRGSGAWCPRWSPNGSYVVFAGAWHVWDEGVSNVYSVPTRGGEPVRLVDEPIGVRDPQFSPDGRRVSYVSRRFPDDQIWIFQGAAAPRTQLLVRHPDYSIVDHRWSSDGLRIVYTVQVGLPEEGRMELFLVPADASSPPQLLFGGIRYFGFDLSPDGDYITYSEGDMGRQSIWVRAVAGGEPVLLTTEEASHVDPAWSPDGTQIVFASNVSGNLDLWRMGADGLNKQQLTFDPGDETEPSWSADGKRIAYTLDSGGIRDIWIQDLPANPN